MVRHRPQDGVPPQRARKSEGQESSQQALQDIEFIKQFLTRNQKKLDQSPPYLFVWGLYMTLGFLGMQFNHVTWPIWFWPIGGLIGSVLSAVIGIKQSRNMPSQEGGSYGWMFWLPFTAVNLSGYFMMVTGMVRMDYISVFWLMLIGISYIGLGTLIGKGPVMLGIWFILLAVLTRLFFLEYQFFIFGLLGGGSIVLTGWLLHLRRGRHG